MDYFFSLPQSSSSGTLISSPDMVFKYPLFMSVVSISIPLICDMMDLFEGVRLVSAL